MIKNGKLALAVIVKDEIEEVKRILRDYNSLFDEIHIAVDYNFNEFCKLKTDYPNLFVYEYKWQKDFAHKRNFLASKINCEYYFRMDCDDAILNPENVVSAFKKAKAEKTSIVYAFYEYAHDDDGNIIAGHFRETIIRNDNNNLYWNKKIHENILPKDTTNYRFVMDKSFRIVHKKTEEQSLTSALRNIEILIEEYNQDKENTDPRTLAYLGRNLLAVNDIDKAMFFLVKHIQKSGWDEDRYMSRIQLAECHIKKDEPEEAKLCAMEAMLEIPSYPDAYLKLHEIYFEQSEWKKALFWGEFGMKQNPPEDSVMLYDPSSYTWRPALTMAYCYFNLNDYDKALALFNYAKKLAPSFNFIKNNSKMFEEAVEDKNFAEKFIYIANFIKSREPNKLKDFFSVIPSDMQDNAYIYNARNKMLPPNTWDKNTVVIYCGPVLDEWADPSVVTGIGGSEEAVIYLSRELTKLGKKVTVFNGCGTMEGEYNGVSYVNYQKFNPRDTFDTLISWRVSIFGFPIIAKNKWVWLHDVQPTKLLPETHIDNIDKVVVLSEFHKSLLPKFVPESKIFVSSNGINLEDFKDYGLKRIPHRIIYASSYDRGLEHLLEIWGKVKEFIPDAELHIFYGWNNIDKLIKSGDYNLLQFKKKMIPLMKQIGITEHGRVGHIKLIKEYQRAGVYAYPCSYEEISCISAMKAQASGCIPVTTDFAALNETVQSGVKVPGKGGTNNEEYAKALINVLYDENYTFNVHTPPTWEDVAKAWVKCLK
jgi:glycosyltransferase involved in cell wall biosynthesis